MRPRLILLLSADPRRPMTWRCLDAQGALVDGGTELASAARQRRAFALVDGTEVVTTAVAMPVRSRQRMAQAVPWALEDQLCEDVETLRFALGNRDAAGHLHVAVYSEDTFAAWEERLADAEAPVEQLYPDYLALPRHEHAWTILVSGGLARVRSGVQAGFACESDNLAVFLEAALTEAADHAPERLVAYLETGEELELPEVAPEAERHRVDDPAGLLAEHLDPQHAIGLRPLAGDVGARLRRHWRVWRAAAVLAAAVVLADTANAWLNQWRLQRTVETQQQRIQEVFRQAFPDAGTPVYPRRQMASRLERLQGAQGDDRGQLLGLLARLAPALADNDLRVEGLAYRGKSLELALEAPRLQAVEALKRRLDGRGLSTTVNSANREGETVSARLTVEPGA